MRMFPVVEQDVLQELQPEPGKCTRHQYQLLQQAITLFKKRWRDEYLTSLHQRHYNGCGVESQHHLLPGALVILVQNSQPKATWPLARILEVYPDEEGLIRTIKVKTEHDIFLRATNLVVPLELPVKAILLKEKSQRRPSLRQKVLVPPKREGSPLPHLSASTAPSLMDNAVMSSLSQG